jgi:hypothetical protein
MQARGVRKRVSIGKIQLKDREERAKGEQKGKSELTL